MIRQIFSFHILLSLLQWHVKHSHGETVSGCTINNNQRRTNNDKTFVTLSCANNGFILVRNLTFGVHKSSLLTSTAPICAYQQGDCTTRTTFIGMECNGLTSCNLDLNPQYLHICSQYSDYMVLDYSCLQGPSLSVCDHAGMSTSLITDNDPSSAPSHRLFLRSPNYPNEYENSLNCSCQVTAKKSNWKFLDFYLEERDEMDLCSRDRLQIANRSYCGSSWDDQKQTASQVTINSSTQLTFKSNDVITRKGFWVMITSEHPVQVSCRNLMEPTTTTMTTMVSSSALISRRRAYSTLSTANASTIAVNSLLSSNDPPTQQKRRHALSYVLMLTVVFVVVLLLLNVVLIILCWRQRRKKEKIDVKSNGTNRPFFCSARSTSSSSSCVTYGETPVLTSLDAQKQSSTSSRYIFQPTQHHLDTTPSTSTTTATTGPYEDLQDSSTLQRPLSKQKTSNDHLLYMQQRHIPSVSLASPQTGYNRMIHFPPAPIRCHFSTPAQTFYPPQPCFDSQHIYETIQDGHCPYQRLAATLRRPAPAPGCSCYYERNEQNHPSRNAHLEKSNLEVNPETLV